MENVYEIRGQLEIPPKKGRDVILSNHSYWIESVRRSSLISFDELLESFTFIMWGFFCEMGVGKGEFSIASFS